VPAVAQAVRHEADALRANLREIVSPFGQRQATVAFHRANIRRKLGIPKDGAQLSTHLSEYVKD
jgi:hypothetical protein